MNCVARRVSCGMGFALALWAAAACTLAAETEGTAEVNLSWEPSDGVVLRTLAGTVLWDRGPTETGPVLRFAANGPQRRLSAPGIERPSERELVLRYETTGPDGNRIEATRRISVAERPGEMELVEEFTLVPSKTIDVDLEIERPFTIRRVRETQQGEATAVLPLYNGWARTFPLDGKGKKGTGPISRNGPEAGTDASVGRAEIGPVPFFPLAGRVAAGQRHGRRALASTRLARHPGRPGRELAGRGVCRPHFGSL